jgi:hypothetical protein
MPPDDTHAIGAVLIRLVGLAIVGTPSLQERDALAQIDRPAAQ